MSKHRSATAAGCLGGFGAVFGVIAAIIVIFVATCASLTWLSETRQELIEQRDREVHHGDTEGTEGEKEEVTAEDAESAEGRHE